MIVLDASALVDVVLDQSTKAWVLGQLQDEELLAPAHQMAEVLSAVARLVRAGVVNTDAAEAALHEARSLKQEVCVPSHEQLARALQMQQRVRVLDALYVVLAEDRRVPLLTTDTRLSRSGLAVPVICPPDAGT